ncbi:MAG: PD40 domain-containing protein [Ignavibacteria bacterium]|nr:PD40 domain-containing protein [Ignavibacteria bacterium]
MMFFSSIILGSMILGLANSAVQAPVPVESCNTSSSEYAPNFDPRSGYMVFTSERSGTAAVYRIMMQPGTKAEPFPGTFNSEDQHRGFISFTSSGEAVGVAYGQYEEQSFPGIVTAPRDNGALNLGHPLTALNGPFFVSHPAISPDGTRLVFVSDRVGGEGGLDLWISDRRDDLSWSTPIGLGRAVNSIEDEISPTFLSADTLLFASNGIGGKGGFDIFFSIFRDGAWQEPIPLDWLNTEFDESDCIILPDGSQVFASNRPGGAGGLDLWVAKRIANSE